jgi:hypothetical protein
MSGIKISKSLRDALPPSEKEAIEAALWQKSGEICFLCGEGMNRASEDLEADHDVPASMGGKTEISNLNLVHKSCNRVKQNSPSTNVRPYLQFQAFARKKGGQIRYGVAAEYFKRSPKETVISEGNGTASFEFPDGSKRSVQIHDEARTGQTFRYVFVDVPQEAIFNDDNCQPRALKLAHVWSILSDLQINPLHEPPACRVEKPLNGTPQQLLMFDGQHKTIAYWLRDNRRIVAKVYLGMDSNSAIQLVNSIQSKIKKLPLSPFELAAKLSDEWEGKLQQYEASVQPHEVSEAGFLNSFADPSERKRAKEAWIAALVQRVLSDQTLDLRTYIQVPGNPKGDLPTITENAAKKKVIEQLIYKLPLSETADEMTTLRSRELQNIVRVLNHFTASAFEIGGGSSPQDKERMKRMMYQSSLQYCTSLIKRLVAHVTTEKEDVALLRGDLNEKNWSKIESGIQLIIAHNIWTADWNTSAKTKAVYDSLQKNQDAEDAFEAVGLKLGYVVGADKPKPSMLK